MNLFRSLRFKLIAFSIIIEVAVLFVLIVNNSRLMESHLTSLAKVYLEDKKADLKATILPLLLVRDYGELKSLLKGYTDSKTLVFVFVEKDGQIVASSNWNSEKTNIKVSDKLNMEDTIFYVKTDLNFSGQDYGDVYFGLDTTFLKNAKNELLTQSLLIAVFAIIVSFILLASIGYYLTKNLALLKDAAENLSNNNFNIQLEIHAKDEIGFLAKTFNKMISQIKNQLTTIKEQNKTQEELIVSLAGENARVKAILENAVDGIHILDLEGNVVMHSDSFAEKLGYSLEEIKDLNVVHLDHTFDRDFIQKLVENVDTFETKYKKKDGTLIDVEIKTAGVELDGNIYLYASSRDVTEKNKAQEELKQKDILLYQQAKMASMGEMIGNIAHQWRQPLSLISTSVTGVILKMEIGMEVQQSEVIENFNRVNDTVQFLSKTIDDFQDYLKPKQQSEEFNIKDVVLKNLKMFGKAFSNYDIEIILDMQDVMINNNQNELLQVVINILNNAKDALKEFKEENRKIFIATYTQDNNAIISIKDNAGGVPSDVLPKIFDAYFTTKEKSQGTGLGLYMSYQIITNRFGGTIAVANEEYEYQGEACKGANFKIILPLQ
jgi:PAS domain S-box-containing protein